MATLYDIGQKVLKIREAVNELEVRGSKNASYVVSAVKNCNEIIQLINNTVEEKKREDEFNEQCNSDTSE